MRTAKNNNGIDVMISTEEYNLLRKILAKKEVPKSSMSGYDERLADGLLRRGVLGYRLDEGEVVYLNIQKDKK